MKHLILFMSLVLLKGIFVSVTAIHTVGQSVIKIACVGNSITFGAGIQNPEMNSYPARLGKLLGNNYEVKNFGVSGTTVQKSGDFPYWEVKAMDNLREYLPDIVVVMFGTNDSKTQNWKNEMVFKQDFLAMIKSFKGLASKPVVFVNKPIPAFEDKWGISDSILFNCINPVIEEISNQEKISCIDLYSAFRLKEHLVYDGIHPNSEGARLIAEKVYKEIFEFVSRFPDRYPLPESEWKDHHSEIDCIDSGIEFIESCDTICN